MNFGSGAERLLHDMPPSADGAQPPSGDSGSARPRRKKRKILLAVIAVIIALPLLAVAFLKSGLIAPLIENEAVAALNEAFPEKLTADIGDATVIARGYRGVGVLIDEFAVRDRATGREIVTVGRTDVGVETLSALRGKPKVDRISLSGIRLSLPAAPGPAQGELPRIAAFGDRLEYLLDAVDMLFNRTTINGSRVNIDISDMVLTGATGDVLVKKAEIVARQGQRAIEAQVEIDDEQIELSGILRRSDGGALTARIRLDGVPIPLGRARTLFSALPDDHLPDAVREPIISNLLITARRSRGDSPDQMTAVLEPVDFSFKLDDGDLIPLSGKLNLAWTPERSLLSLRDSPVRLGRSSATLSGGFRDRESGSAAGSGHSYEFELLANDAISDPADSPVRPVPFAARAQGTWSPLFHTVDFDRIEIKSRAGYAEGAGTLDFDIAVPTAIFAISIEDFALAGVKQFWPAPVARAARRWVMSNLAGGRITRGDFLIAEPLRRRVAGSDVPLQGDTELTLDVDGVRFDVTGGIPPVRDAKGRVEVKGGDTKITLERGTTYMPSGRTAAASGGTLTIHAPDTEDLVYADLDVHIAGSADALGELISFRPINARQYRDYEPEELSGQATARVTMRFTLNPRDDTPPPDWNVILDIEDAAISTPFEGRMLSEMAGRIVIDRTKADIDVAGKIDGVPADVVMEQPFGGVATHSSRDIVLKLSDADRQRIAPGLDPLVSGITSVNVKSQPESETMAVEADLSEAELSIPWIGWAKGSGIAAKTVFDLVLSDDETRISNFELDGGSFFAQGDIMVSKTGLQNARFGRVRLNETDDVTVSIEAKGKGFSVDITGKSFDARAIIRHVREQLKAKDHEEGVPVELTASIAKVTGFGDETVRNLKLFMRYDGSDVVEVTASGTTASGFPFLAELKGAAAKRTIRAESLDAGELLRFLDIYGQVRGGIITVSLKASSETVMTGNADLTDFRIFNEPRLNALVSSKSDDSGSLREAIKRDIDTREVVFDRASAELSISPYMLQIKDGAIRGPLVGSTFRGTLYDKNDRMRIAGTFMPAYAANSLLTGIPIVGLVLGNGRDRGLIGVTYLLEGDTDKPKITVNPLSVIAPGVFRQIFEFR